MLLEAEFDAGHQPVETGKEPGFKIAMPPPFDTDGFETSMRTEPTPSSGHCFLFQPVDEVLHCRSLGSIRQRHRVVCEHSGQG